MSGRVEFYADRLTLADLRRFGLEAEGRLVWTSDGWRWRVSIPTHGDPGRVLRLMQFLWRGE